MTSKYFSPLIGNPFARDMLLRLAKQPLSLPLLFVGMEGVGKRLFARAFIQTLWGESHARRVEAATHPDVFWLEPEGKTMMHSVDSVRALVAEAYIRPFEAPHKILVIEAAERMLPVAANTLLKTLEELPSSVLVILCSSCEVQLLPTIVSRCLKIPFQGISEELLVQALEERGVSAVQARQRACLAGGSLARALIEEDPLEGHFLDVVERFCFTRISPAFLEELEELDKKMEKKEEESRAQLGTRFVSALLLWMRDLAALQSGLPVDTLFYRQRLAALERHKVVPIPSFSYLHACVETALLAWQRHTKTKTILEQLFFALTPATYLSKG